jgi:ankyrin repeat protein
MGFDECVQLLIEHGASMEVLMGPTKMTALHLAAQDGNVESLQLLVEGGANVEAKNVRGQTALHLASLAQSPETAEVLLKAGKSIYCCYSLFSVMSFGKILQLVCFTIHIKSSFVVRKMNFNRIGKTTFLS